MATIPNRYYNSPFIEDAGRNLAAALMPPDPEKTLAAQHAKFKFDREQQLARIQDEDRARMDAASPAVARLISDQYDPALLTGTGPEQMGFAEFMAAGQPEQLTDPNAPSREADLQTVARTHKLGDVMALAGPDNPKTRSAIALLERKLANQNLRDDERAELQIQLAHLRGGYAQDRTDSIIAGQGSRQAAGFEHDFEIQDRKFAHDFGTIQARADAAAKKAGNKPIKMPESTYKSIRLAVKRFERENNYPLDEGERREVEALVAEEWQNNPSVPIATNIIFKRHLLGEGGEPRTETITTPRSIFGIDLPDDVTTRPAPQFGDAILPGAGVRLPPGQKAAPTRPPLSSFQR